MEGPPSAALLQDLWFGEEGAQLRCYQCQLEIGPNDALARTFMLQSRNKDSSRTYTKQLHVPSLSKTLYIYDRHLECLLKSTKYVTWHEHGIESVNDQSD